MPCFLPSLPELTQTTYCVLFRSSSPVSTSIGRNTCPLPPDVSHMFQRCLPSTPLSSWAPCMKIYCQFNMAVAMSCTAAAPVERSSVCVLLFVSASPPGPLCVSGSPPDRLFMSDPPPNRLSTLCSTPHLPLSWPFQLPLSPAAGESDFSISPM